ncbi:tripartite tricarboxylate transporter TctB family protein [Alcaligenaceae bacterium]|nr:tripartite tricarboxylate transporter TctB family protein [Alcaligenaceae bacterium]
MQIKNKQDFWSGLMFITIGLGFALGATQYSLGTTARMGPGYFPFWLGVFLAVLGAVVAITAMSNKAEHAELEKFDIKLAFIIVGSVVLSGAALYYLGVFIATFLLVFLSSLASHEFNWKIAVANGAFLVLFVWVAFIKGLGLVFPLWPFFLTN